MENIKSGFVSIIGRPSSGKSTLVNQICGYKISSVSALPQTTQFVIKGIYNDDESQIIFLDTPGFHHYNSNLNRGLSNLASRTAQEGDVVLYLVDLTREYGEEEKAIGEIVASLQVPLVVVFNKCDCKEDYKAETEKIVRAQTKACEYLKISALSGEGCELLANALKKHLPEGPRYYPVEYVTDQSIPFRIKEVVREQVLLNFTQEVPHSVYVEVGALEDTEKRVTAEAVIFVERESQKGILIGKGGTMIGLVRERATAELKKIFEKNVKLSLKVKVHHNWRQDQKFLKKKFEIE